MCRLWWQRYLLQALLLISSGSLSFAILEPADPQIYPLSAEIGKDGLIVYEDYERGELPDHRLCLPYYHNCTTPHGLCYDDHDKYQLVSVGDPVSEDGGHKWFCGIQIKDVSFDDVGAYEICKLSFKDAHTTNGCLKNEGFHVNFAVWKRDAHGRICQTSYNETLEEVVNNCTSSTTQALTKEPSTTEPSTTEPSTTEPSTTEEEEETTSTAKAVESLIYTPPAGGGSNDAIKDPKNSEDNETCTSKRDMILTAVGVFIGTLAFVAVILAIRQVRKRRRRSRFDPYEGYSPGLSMGSQPVANGAAHHENDVA